MQEQKTEFLGLPSVAAELSDSQGRSWPVERWLVQRLLASLGNPPVRVRLWDDSEVAPEDGNTCTAVLIGDRGALWRLVRQPMLHFGDDYSTGRIEVEGDLVRFLDTVFRFRPRAGLVSPTRRLLLERLQRVRRNTLRGSRENIHHHYDIGNAFYRLWLDERMQYTCAYFPDPTMDLAAAQQAKLDHVCRKLQIKPGDTVVEAGCGWGGLARHMARYYGARVRAYNISTEQVAYAREQARAEGLEDRVEYVLDDYRNISGKYDVFVSVGMLEHVGAEQYVSLGGVVDRCLKQDGRGLIHTIGQNQATPMSAWAERRIFPGAYPPTLREMMMIFEPYDFSVLDVENLRLHYAKTLEHWLARFDAHAAQVEQMFDANFVRAWRLYLASSVASFSSGSLQLFQVLFTRGQHNELPWSRAHLYDDGGRRDGEL